MSLMSLMCYTDDHMLIKKTRHESDHIEVMFKAAQLPDNTSFTIEYKSDQAMRTARACINNAAKRYRTFTGKSMASGSKLTYFAHVYYPVNGKNVYPKV